MRVAYVCADPGVPVFGRKGSSIHVQEVLRGLRRRGVEVELFASRCEGARPPGLEDVSALPIPAPAAGQLAAREQEALAANRSLAAALERGGPYDLVYERYALWSFAAMEYARAAGIPGLLEVNAPLIEEQEEHRGLVDRGAAEAATDRCFGAASTLLAVSEEMASYLERRPAARGRVQVVANGVDPERIRPGLAPSCPGGPGVFTVGFVGTLKPWHGLPVLVEAFARLCGRDGRVRLLVVGDGPERAALEEQINGLGLAQSVVLTGAVAADEVPALLASMDVAVAPYPPRSPFYFSPLKVYEYMAAGLPVVASRIGQLEQLLEDGACGILCPPGDPAALAEALDAVRSDPDLRQRRGRRARAKVVAESTWDAVVARILALARSAAPEPAAEAVQ